MDNEVCLAAIRNHYNYFTKIERQIADYILANSEAVVDMNVAGLAEATGTAGSAVIRFCKSTVFPNSGSLLPWNWHAARNLLSLCFRSATPPGKQRGKYLTPVFVRCKTPYLCWIFPLWTR